jgi:hypothetical protein
MSDQTQAGSNNSHLHRCDDDIRDLAVARVDGRHGYTVEFAPDPETHRAEYDDEEARIRHERRAETSVIPRVGWQ